MDEHALEDNGWCRCGGWVTDAREGSWERQHRFEHHQLRRLLEELPQLLRRTEEPAVTAATRPELVCTCEYKPFPHRRQPAHWWDGARWTTEAEQLQRLAPDLAPEIPT